MKGAIAENDGMTNGMRSVATKEKYAIYLDRADLNRLREYQVEVGVPVSESIRHAIAGILKPT